MEKLDNQEGAKIEPPIETSGTASEKPSTDPANNQVDLSSSQLPHKQKGIKKHLTKRNIIITTLVILLGLIALTDLKYVIAGIFVKGNAEITVADSKTLQPIPGAVVSISGKTAKTGDKGKALLKGVNIGRKTVNVSKPGYDASSTKATLGFGTTSLEPILLKGKGLTAAFIVKDKITSLPLEGVTVKTASNKAITNKKGQALLNVLPRGGVPVKISASKPGYSDTTLEVKVDGAGRATQINLAPAVNVYFISNKSGKYDLYSSDAAGNQKIALAATGKEDQRTQVLPSATGKYVALVSAREGQRDAAGNLSEGLYVIDAATGQYSKVDSATNYTSLEWYGETLVALKNGTISGDYTNILFVYNATTKQKTSIAGVSGYSAAIDRLFYSLTDKNKPEFGLFTTKLDGSDKRKLSDATVYSMFRTSPNTIVFNNSDDNTWKSINSDTRQTQNLQGQPSESSDTIYAFSPDKTKVAYSQERDGATRLIVKPVGTDQETQVSGSGNVINFGWVSNDYLVYLLQDSNGSAIYIGAANGKGALKISNAYVPKQSSFFGR